MTVIRRTNPLGKRLALRRVLDGKRQPLEQPPVVASDRSRLQAETGSTGHQSGREHGA